VTYRITRLLIVECMNIRDLKGASVEWLDKIVSFLVYRHGGVASKNR
jgi:hypothetical protein